MQPLLTRTRFVIAIASGALLAQAAALAPIASAQCADPRGNSYCTNGGQVTFTSPPSQAKPAAQNPNPPTNVNIQNPNPPTNVNVQNPSPPTNVDVQNPSPPTNVDGQNPSPPTNVDGQNPNAGDSGAQNPMPGQVNFNPPPGAGAQTTTSTAPGQPQVAPQAPPAGPSTAVVGQGNGSVSVDPPGAAADATVTVTVSGMPPNSGFVVNLGQLKTSTGLTLGAKSMQTADGSALRTGPDGTFSGTFTVPSVPDSTAPSASVCASVLGRVSYCTPFTLQSAGQPPVNDATPQSIVGHYQCSSLLQVGRGSQWCNGTEPLLVLNADGTYSFGDDSGTYAFDPDSFAISFSGQLGTGSILNRKLVTDSSVNGGQVRYTYIRMDY